MTYSMYVFAFMYERGAVCLFVCLLSALASAFTVPTPASQGSLLICASPVYSKGECRSTSLKRKVRPNSHFSFGGYRGKTIDIVKSIFPRGNYPPL